MASFNQNNNPHWYNVERVSQKGSVVLNEWNKTSSPTAIKNRQQMVVHRRGFNAARIDRLTSTFFAQNLAINEELRSDLDATRGRSRNVSKNNEYGKKFTNLCVANIVGPTGFNFQARTLTDRGEPDQQDNATLERSFKKWMRKGVCEMSGRLSFLDVKSTLVRGLAKDGEFIVREIRGRAARNPFNYALDLIDVDRLDTKLNQPASNSQNAIVMGIEIDEYRRPLFYHIFKAHPNGNNANMRVREKIPASEIIHCFIQEESEQVRGIPWMSASLLTLHHLGEFEQSALLAARKGANTLGFFVSPDGTPPPINGETVNDQPIDISVPGEYDTLPDGYDFKPYESKYPDAMLGEFTKGFLRRIASGFNVSYNGLSSDLENVNFSSIRSGVIDEREQWMTIQGWFIESFLTPVYEHWLEMSLLANAITNISGFPLPAGKIEKFKAHQWQGRRWQWVDPMRDIEASIKAIENNLTSPYTIASQMGLDLDDVMQEIARANSEAAKLGLNKFGAQAPSTNKTTPPDTAT